MPTLVGDVARWWGGGGGHRLSILLNYVFVSPYAIAGGGTAPESRCRGRPFVIVVTGAIYFADSQMKTAVIIPPRLPDTLECR